MRRSCTNVTVAVAAKRPRGETVSWGTDTPKLVRRGSPSSVVPRVSRGGGGGALRVDVLRLDAWLTHLHFRDFFCSITEIITNYRETTYCVPQAKASYGSRSWQLTACPEWPRREPERCTRGPGSGLRCVYLAGT